MLDTNAVLILGLQSASAAGKLARAFEGQPRFVSQVCAIEIAIKQSIGKLALPPPFQTAFVSAFNTLVEDFGASMLPIAMAHVDVLARLPLRHRDPFDRLIVSQALAEGLTIVTRDRSLADYDGVDILGL
ncbi:MAG TPA: type II toxin-antitoxin system VapC family toxin [Caulobacteraceae bacterium]|nr:type II toxin-antitoxin system VapC family toxin [Caulobacteraceae bacterium]